MDIRDFVRTIGRHLYVFAAVFVIIVGIGLAAAFLRPNRYEATATIIGVPPNGQTDFNSVEAVQFLLPTVVKDVSTVTFANRARDTRGPGSSPPRARVAPSPAPGPGR